MSERVVAWLRVGLIGFGAAGRIFCAAELVGQREHWIGVTAFEDANAACAGPS